ncbi:hypothetical protein P7C73_g2269, partial [Tremellales sp. Uapishka_1]
MLQSQTILPVLLALGVRAISIPSGSPSSVLLTSIAPTPNLPACLQSSYYGSFGGPSESQDHIYLLDSECTTNQLHALSQGSLVGIPQEEGRLVWVGQAGVAESLRGDISESWEAIQGHSWALIASSQIHAESQHVLGSHQSHTAPIQLLHQSASSLLLHVPTSYLPILDTLLPSHLVPVALPTKPLASGSLWDSVPEKLVKNLANITKHLKFSSEIDKIVSDGIVLDDVRRNIRWLTGEGPSGIVSRHSFTEGATKAAHWIKDKVEATGAKCGLHSYLPGFSPSVLCEYPSTSNSTEMVILSAHYDSRGSFGNTRAPGGDDDGSGSGHLLGIAEAIKSQGVSFEKRAILCWFSGEEQGLYGSHYFAEYLRGINASVILQVQADMLAYHAPGETLQIALPESIHLPEATYLIGNLSHLYAPELVVGRTASCCSDHQSFLSYGFPATQVSERNGPIADPEYHSSGDLSGRENYDFSQVVSIAKVTMSALLTVAGYTLKK